MAGGAYTVRWFSPATATWQPEQCVEVQGGTTALAVPALAQDLAVKLIAVKTGR